MQVIFCYEDHANLSASSYNKKNSKSIPSMHHLRKHELQTRQEAFQSKMDSLDVLDFKNTQHANNP